MTQGEPVRELSPGRVCGYCLWRIDSDDEADLRTCSHCGARFHGDCFVENGGCTVFGCAAWTARQMGLPEPEVPVVRGVPAAAPSMVQTEDIGGQPSARRFCAQCGNPVTVGWRFCGSCGEAIETVGL